MRKHIKYNEAILFCNVTVHLNTLRTLTFLSETQNKNTH